MIRRSNFFGIIFTTVFTFSAIYAPQPLLNVLGAEFSVDKATASLLITVTLLPLGLAPILYGLLLESISSKKLMCLAVGLLCVSELGIFLARTFTVLLALRLLQGVLIPAILTALMTYVSTTSRPDGVQKAMSIYIASTIFGGFFGRFLAGFVATQWGWRYSFFTLFIALGIGLWLLLRIEADPRIGFERLNYQAALAVLRVRTFRSVYFLIFCSFFVFAALFNFLPFRLKEIESGVSEFRIALMYSGYLVGVVIALTSGRLIRLFGRETRVILVGLCCYLASIPVFAATDIPLVFLGILLFCTGMFLVHSVSPGYINTLAESRKGVVNGLYISFYYSGGTIGSYFPGMLYKHYGWTAFIVLLGLIVALALSIGAGLRRTGASLPASGAEAGEAKANRE